MVEILVRYHRIIPRKNQIWFDLAYISEGTSRGPGLVPPFEGGYG